MILELLICAAAGAPCETVKTEVLTCAVPLIAEAIIEAEAEGGRVKRWTCGAERKAAK